MKSSNPITLLLALATALTLPALASAQQGESAQQGADDAGPAPAAPGSAAQPADQLALDQTSLADRYRRLEQLALRLAELSAPRDPGRAALLREMIARSKQQDVGGQFQSIVDLLQADRLAQASGRQSTLDKELRNLLQLLMKENRAERIESERQRLQKYLKQLGRIIRQQRSIKGRTESGDPADKLAAEQDSIAARTGELAEQMAEDRRREAGDTESEQNEERDAQPSPDQPQEGKPGEGQPQEGSPQDGKPQEGKSQEGKPQPGQPQDGQPSDSPPPQDDAPTEKAIRAAHQRMQDAIEKLREAKRDGALDDQQQAIEQLQDAKAKLEEILRQLREEERQQMLVMLEARFRRMLALQIQVHDATIELDKVPAGQRDHDHEIKSGRLSRTEALIEAEANRAIALMSEDGSSVAFPEAAEQMRADIQQVVVRLARAQVGAVTQAIERDIIESLEELIGALQKAMQDSDKRKANPMQAGEMQEPPLVDVLAELKLIRSLQFRVNRRTQQFAQLVDAGTVNRAELASSLKQLADREEKIYNATRQLHLKKSP